MHVRTGARLSLQDLAVLADGAEYVDAGPVAVTLDLGLPIDSRRADDGATALHVTAYTGRADVVRLLLAADADIEARVTPRSTMRRYRRPAWAAASPPRYHPRR
jgi:ankyrin repeat protein